MNYINKTLVIFYLVAVAALEFGCGEGNEAKAPAVLLTASTVASQADATAHTHMVTIPFTDVSVSPVSDTFQYRSSISDGHTHVIALTKQQVIDINNGMRVVLTSSVPNSGTSHTHTWGIQGGDLLYDKNCFNCHSYSKRGGNPMNVAFNPSQIFAVKNPAGAPLSTSPAATPDPNYVLSSGVSLDGVALYAANCASCHNQLATSTKLNRSFLQIKTAITSNSGGMASLGALSDAQIQAIAAALIK
ncbi:MAG: cytochrome c [Desulfuromonadales bacterium]|nr:cytochrome c [Desulfuromonadales bacterium]